MENELMLKIENVSKIYKLGEIGGTTLRETLQRTRAKLLKKEDPTKKVGAKNYNKGEKFKALDNVSFEVKKGERIGIIGHNGAGKSTLLKLISRVTGPSSGTIYMNGRVASMLEVGTGFHPELTGRENVYMNGAILGMTKKEIDAKMEDIIEFSEVRQFIDTPVKRYSSGMYVKLAFSVAAHLDSEIMIMDEVLAVGDALFQEKCISKMRELSIETNRTVLYVSHNMNTIRQLCDRVIVLEKGKIIFDGEPEDGINIYLRGNLSKELKWDVSAFKRLNTFKQIIKMKKIEILNKKTPLFQRGERVEINVDWESDLNIDELFFRLTISSGPHSPIGAMQNRLGTFVAHTLHKLTVNLGTEMFAPGTYFLTFEFYSVDRDGTMKYLDFIKDLPMFEIYDNSILKWNPVWWGYINKFDLDVVCDSL